MNVTTSGPRTGMWTTQGSSVHNARVLPKAVVSRPNGPKSREPTRNNDGTMTFSGGRSHARAVLTREYRVPHRSTRRGFALQTRVRTFTTRVVLARFRRASKPRVLVRVGQQRLRVRVSPAGGQRRFSQKRATDTGQRVGGGEQREIITRSTGFPVAPSRFSRLITRRRAVAAAAAHGQV